MPIKRIFTLGLLLLSLSAIFANTAVAKDVTMKGSYKWQRKKGATTGAIAAIFTPAGKNKWTVVFKFDWKKTPHIYTGVVTGSVTDGKIEGKVLNDNKKRTFTFTGTVKDGILKASHKEIKKRRGKETSTDTGTIELKTS